MNQTWICGKILHHCDIRQKWAFFAIYKKYPAELAEWVDRCGTGRETA